MKKIDLSACEDATPEVDTGLLTGWLNRTDLARELTLSVDTLQRWETRRMGPPCVRVGRKVLYRMEAVRDWLREQEARKQGTSRAVAARR
ncbi:helix-turn-helix transcriptional regulator [Pararhizobium antarcticum]|uniref:Transcriptional regulator n=1 Tax=Pararhizobium antarcticum TaxID=1798805 RepID=A0A657LNR4_9HYPH|nr:helix-turn-helix domain-containing protein [Pararhizobium antarcticum]OJF91632.1 transcriptional regulator [Pararhizobium antarcticum]